MKTSVLLLIVIISVLALGTVYFFIQNRSFVNSHPENDRSTAISTTIQGRATDIDVSDRCQQQQLQGTVSFSPGAGNVYGAIELKNISDTTCIISAKSGIIVSYPQSITNISLQQVGETSNHEFTLAPGSSIYSQIHYPNGPQCGSGIRSSTITIQYPLTADTSVTFTDSRGGKTVDISVCEDPSENTEIRIWRFSDQSITS